MDKNDEKVLVVASDVLFKDGIWQGLKTDNLDYYLDLIKNNCQFKRRGDVENDSSWQQIIPYVLFNFGDKYFIYKYLPEAGEKRLVDTYQFYQEFPSLFQLSGILFLFLVLEFHKLSIPFLIILLEYY